VPKLERHERISMKTNTVKGTNDWLPAEMKLRDYIQNTILETYLKNGFNHISTPVIEDAENLDKSEGGENLNLIFKVLKRGDKLEEAVKDIREGGDEKELSDMGLRYDLTLPLTRFFANNRDKLVMPAKCIQIDRVYRAERPQKGRMREFIQCDIDILGSKSPCCETELISVTAEALLNLGFRDFRIRINDRRILRAVLEGLGFAADTLDSVCISFDKLDKIGAEGVAAELTEKGFPEKAVEGLKNLLAGELPGLSKVREVLADTEDIDRLESIIASAKELADGRYDIVFDLSLVRGQGYYTGTVFEIESPKFRGAIGGGGRYDNLIGKFIGESVPAVGFSIGFERLFSILYETGYTIPTARKQVALIFKEQDFAAAAKKARELRGEYDVSLFEFPKKLGKFLDRLTERGYYGFTVYGESEEIKLLS
jgi:histidyl-tRNA synthetase